MGRKNQFRRRRKKGLEVVARRRQRWRRWRRALAAGVLVAGVTALGVWAHSQWPRWRQQWLAGERLFPLKEIQITTPLRAVTREQILLRSGLRAGQNLLAIDLARVRRALEEIPYAAEVSVERVLPHVVRIGIIERRPVARVRLYSRFGEESLEARICYLDGEGMVMPGGMEGRPGDDPFADEPLPEVVGVDPTEVTLGQVTGDLRLRWALRLIEVYRQLRLDEQAGLRTIDLTETGVLHVALDNGVRATLGPDELPRQLLRLFYLQEVGRANGRRLLQVDLSIPNNCPSLWTPAEPSAPSAGFPKGVLKLPLARDV